MSHYKDFVVLDTETTGLDAPIKPVEIAWLRINEKMEVIDSFRSLVNPGREINPGAAAIHGITAEMVADAPSPAEVAAKLPEQFVVIGHNTPFDCRVMAELIEWQAEVCTLALARRWVPEAPNHKLPTLKEFLKLSDQESHTALGDCHTSLEVLRICAERAGRDLLGLIDLEKEPKMLPKMPFGMHKGKPFHLVPKDYRDWLIKREGLHKDLLYTLQMLDVK